MLKYFVSTTEYLIVAGVLVSMILVYIRQKYEGKGLKIAVIGSIAGFAAAIVMAVLKNKTKLINTGVWNTRIFTVALIALVLFLIMDTKAMQKKFGDRGYLLAAIPAAVLAGLHLLYACPDVLAYPYTIMLGGESIISTGFLYRFIGILFAVILVVLTGFAVWFVCVRIKPSSTGTLLKIGLIITGVQQFIKILQQLYSKHIISGSGYFTIIKFASNHSALFIYAVLLTVVFLPVVLWIRSFHVNEPYKNPAEHRKIRAKWMRIRRWSTCLIICIIITVLDLTAVKAYVEKPVELSAIEECELRGDSLYIPFSQVDDGNLHRFAYVTDNNVAVRFIIIKKPNSSAYGVGLDACDICGETGYYQRGTQVVCNRCDVVMNINTIGFKGGCNPKVIDYSIENGYIIVPIDTLIEHESDFK